MTPISRRSRSCWGGALANHCRLVDHPNNSHRIADRGARGRPRTSRASAPLALLGADRPRRAPRQRPAERQPRPRPAPRQPHADRSHTPTRPLMSRPCPPPPVARSSSLPSTSWPTRGCSPSWPPTPRPPAGMASSSGTTSSTARRRARCWTRGSRWPRSRWPPTRSSPGPMVTPLSRRRPHKLARETATLDLLSNGRLDPRRRARLRQPRRAGALRRRRRPARAGRAPRRVRWSSWRTTGAGRSCPARSSSRASRSGWAGPGPTQAVLSDARRASGRRLPHRPARPRSARRTGRRDRRAARPRRPSRRFDLVDHQRPRHRPRAVGGRRRDLVPGPL